MTAQTTTVDGVLGLDQARQRLAEIQGEGQRYRLTEAEHVMNLMESLREAEKVELGASWVELSVGGDYLSAPMDAAGAFRVAANLRQAGELVTTEASK